MDRIDSSLDTALSQLFDEDSLPQDCSCSLLLTHQFLALFSQFTRCTLLVLPHRCVRIFLLFLPGLKSRPQSCLAELLPLQTGL